MIPKMGKTFPATNNDGYAEGGYAAAVAASLVAELGDTHRAIKTVMHWTGASERTVKNWLAGTSGPSGEHLIAIIRHSDAVFGTVMLMAGRNEVVTAKKLADSRDTLVAMLEVIVGLTT